MSESMLFHGWESLLRIIIVGSAAYAFLVVVLRVSGKRTLSKMNAFDLVITVALGSTLATVLMDRASLSPMGRSGSRCLSACNSQSHGCRFVGSGSGRW